MSCIGYQRLYSNLFYPIIQELKRPAVMMVSRMDTIPKDPAILIARGLYCIGKYTLMFPFVESSTFRVRSTCFNRLFFFATGWARWRVIVIILSFSGRLPCASRSSLISFFSRSSKNKASSWAMRFCIFLLFALAFTWVESTKTSLGSISLNL